MVETMLGVKGGGSCGYVSERECAQVRVSLLLTLCVCVCVYVCKVTRVLSWVESVTGTRSATSWDWITQPLSSVHYCRAGPCCSLHPPYLGGLILVKKGGWSE